MLQNGRPPRSCAQTFDIFLKWIGEDPFHRKLSQTLRIQRACGTPCKYDALLRTESLTQDWANLLAGLQIPPIKLPRLNHGQPSLAAIHPDAMSRSQLDALANQLQQTHARVVHPDGRTDGYVLHPDDMPETEAPSFGESSPELGNVMGQLTEEQKATLRAQLGHEL